MKRDLIYPQGSRTMNEETRGELCKQLVLAGYTVRLITIKDDKGRQKKAIEYWKETTSNE